MWGKAALNTAESYLKGAALSEVVHEEKEAPATAAQCLPGTLTPGDTPPDS